MRILGVFALLAIAVVSIALAQGMLEHTLLRDRRVGWGTSTFHRTNVFVLRGANRPGITNPSACLTAVTGNRILSIV